MAATIKQVAKLADVSPATVSYVLNGTGTVTETTRRRVLQAVEIEEKAETRRERSGRERFRFLLPRFGWSLAIAGLVAIGIQYRSIIRSKPEEVLVNLPVDFAKLPTPDVLADFDAINQLRQAAVTTDDQLLEALQ